MKLGTNNKSGGSEWDEPNLENILELSEIQDFLFYPFSSFFLFPSFLPFSPFWETIPQRMTLFDSQSSFFGNAEL